MVWLTMSRECELYNITVICIQKRKVYIFKHDSILENCPSHGLFDKIIVKEKEGIMVPRAFTDYEITVDETMPEGVELICK